PHHPARGTRATKNAPCPVPWDARRSDDLEARVHPGTPTSRGSTQVQPPIPPAPRGTPDGATTALAGLVTVAGGVALLLGRVRPGSGTGSGVVFPGGTGGAGSQPAAGPLCPGARPGTRPRRCLFRDRLIA